MEKCPGWHIILFSEVFTCGSIPKQVSDEHREFVMGATSVADTTWITLAGISSIFLHNYICDCAVDNPSPMCPS